MKKLIILLLLAGTCSGALTTRVKETERFKVYKEEDDLRKFLRDLVIWNEKTYAELAGRVNWLIDRDEFRDDVGDVFIDGTLDFDGALIAGFHLTWEENRLAVDDDFIRLIGDTTGAMTENLNLDDDTLVISYNDNKVGIGTSNPAGTLTVDGSFLREGSTMYGSQTSGHINLGVTSITGKDGEDFYYATVGGGYENEARGTGSTVAGGHGNSALDYYAMVPGGRDNQAGGSFSFAAGRHAKVRSYADSGEIGGDKGTFVWADSNSVDFESTGIDQFLVKAAGGVAFGTNTPVTNAQLTINGGIARTTSTMSGVDAYTHINLGLESETGSEAEDNEVSTISGGRHNVAEGAGATVGGGRYNTAQGKEATVSGGRYNRTYDSTGATIGGGQGNDVGTGDLGTIGGGSNNRTRELLGTIAGGGYNDAQSKYSTIGGGTWNLTEGEYATIPGGRSNYAGGHYSFAAGRKAVVRNSFLSGDADGDEGTFVWSDSSEPNFVSSGPNQFLIKATGGVGINTNNPATALDVDGTITATGVTLNGDVHFDGVTAGYDVLWIKASNLFEFQDNAILGFGTSSGENDDVQFLWDGDSFEMRGGGATGAAWNIGSAATGFDINWTDTAGGTVKFDYSGSRGINFDGTDIFMGDGDYIKFGDDTDGQFYYDNANDQVRLSCPDGSSFRISSGNNPILVTSPIAFTQTDGNEYIDSEDDAHMDYGATTSHDFNIGGTEQVEIVDGALSPTTDNDIDLGDSTHEFKDGYFDGTLNADLILMEPSVASGTGNRIIDIVPSAPLEEGAHWTGLRIDGNDLDPCGIDTKIRGVALNFSNVDLTYPTDLDVLRILAPNPFYDAIRIIEGKVRHSYTSGTDALAKYTVHDIVIDAISQDSTSETHAFDVALANGLSGEAVALGTHTGIDPIHQHIGTYTDITLDALWDDSETSYLAFADENIWVADDDALCVGHTAKFDEIQLVFDTAATKDCFLKFYYWKDSDPDAWEEFYPDDDTDGGRQDGLITFDGDDLADWLSADPTGQGSGYWIKIERNRVNDPGTVNLSTHKYLIATTYYWNKDGDISAAAGTFTSLSLNDTNTQITEDGSGNMTFKDAVYGTKTLSEMGSPTMVDVSDTTVAEGYNDIAGFNNKVLIKWIEITTSSTDWTFTVYEDDDAPGAHVREIVSNRSGNYKIYWDYPYEDADASSEFHYGFVDDSGANTHDIRVLGFRLL